MNSLARKISYSFTSKILLLLVFIIASCSLSAQNKKEKLQNEQKRIKQEIAYTNKLLNETEKVKKKSLAQSTLLSSLISSREDYIRAINSEIYYLNNQIIETQKQIEKLTQELKALKDEYAKMIYFSYKNRNSYDRLMFIFTADDFNQAYRRLKYLQQYNEHRRRQAELIVNAQLTLALKKEELEKQKSEKVELLITKEVEKNNLKKEKTQKDQTIAQLKNKERDLRKNLRAKEAQARKLKRKLKEILDAELKPKTGTTASKSYDLTPDEIKLSEVFSTNKGKLPWPSERGVVSGHFGPQHHEVLDYDFDNFGIDILTNKDQEARVVFKGVVRYIIPIANTKAVLVKHGEYYTLYSNLDEVYVKAGEEVSTKQALGKIHTDPEDNKTELHFELWKGKVRQNPAYWLAKKR
ncbi:MAG: peptidoglycan DD-metalloendopeptidase family protein [Saprospiraceae bacterium]|nr:peptidoglycan DD-metalloendopeptidase family protein [Saprospiraceae bacterium]